MAKLVVVLAAAAVLVAGGTAAVLLTHATTPLSAIGGPGTSPTPQPGPPVLAVSGQTSGNHTATLSWKQPLTLAVTDGTLRSVTATGPQGALAGTLTATQWTGTAGLVPSSTYTLHAVVADAAGKTKVIDRTVTTTAASSVLRGIVSPDSMSVGVGQPIVITLNHPVRGTAARAALLQHITVTTSPAVEGAWRFIGSQELHYRPRVYWAPGTKVKVVVDVRHWRLPKTDTWGTPHVTTATFGVGDSMVSTVDITAHTMTVRRNGQVVRTMKVSTGRDVYPTKGGVHIILTVEREYLYDSSTVGIPTSSPDGYYEKLPYSMRISNGGAFVHANPATVKYQGVLNVSHGCVNLSLADAKWFYENSHRGDIVNIVHSVVGPVLSDPGTADWNLSFADWKASSLG